MVDRGHAASGLMGHRGQCSDIFDLVFFDFHQCVDRAVSEMGIHRCIQTAGKGGRYSDESIHINLLKVEGVWTIIYLFVWQGLQRTALSEENDS